MKALANGHIESPKSSNPTQPFRINSNSVESYPVGLRNGSLANHNPKSESTSRNQASLFDSIHDQDILTMAAQRDQLRVGSRNVRGMMAPIMSKTVSFICRF